MPYQTLSDLPEAVQKKLTEHTQSIYRASFNNAWSQYGANGEKYGGSQEEYAHRIAWAAVKNKYQSQNGRWKLKEG